MLKTIYLLALFLFTCVGAYSQPTPVDYHSPAIQKAQRFTTDKFLNSLQNGDIDDAINLIDSSFINTKQKYKDSLFAYYKELSKLIKWTQLSVVIVYPDRSYNTFRCRYYSEKGEFFYLDLYFNTADANSLIKRIWKKPEKELAMERKEVAKRAKEEEKTGPPPPPKLPPAGVEITPIKKNN